MSIKENKVAIFLYDKIRSLITCFSPELTSRITYRVSWGKKLDLKNPQDFNQKIMWLKLRVYGKDPVVSKCVDKYAVREYVKEHGCGDYLNDLIGVYDCVEDIPWKSLPDKFVLKLNNSCGANIICKDKSRLDIEAAKKQLYKWYKEKYYLKAAEIQYSKVSRKIICEK